jgi:hypothetical protein
MCLMSSSTPEVVCIHIHTFPIYNHFQSVQVSAESAMAKFNAVIYLSIIIQGGPVYRGSNVTG